MLLRNASEVVCIGFQPWEQMERILRNEQMLLGEILEIIIHPNDQLTRDEAALARYLTADLPKDTLAILCTGNCPHTAIHELAAQKARYLLLVHRPDGSLEKIVEVDGRKRHVAWTDNGTREGQFAPLAATA